MKCFLDFVNITMLTFSKGMTEGIRVAVKTNLFGLECKIAHVAPAVPPFHI